MSQAAVRRPRVLSGAFFCFAACLGPFRSRLLVNTVGPLVLIAVAIAACSAAGAILGLVTSKMTWRDGAAFGGAVAVVIVWVLVPPVSKTVFEVYDCENFGVSDVVNVSSSDVHAYAYFLHADMSISCSSGDYGSLLGLASLFVVIWPIAMPVLLAALLVGAHKSKKASKSSMLSRATVTPDSSATSRDTHSSSVSPNSTKPARVE